MIEVKLVRRECDGAAITQIWVDGERKKSYVGNETLAWYIKDLGEVMSRDEALELILQIFPEKIFS